MRTQQAIQEAEKLLDRATDLLIEDPRDPFAAPLLGCASIMCLIATNNFVELSNYPNVTKMLKNPPQDLLEILERALQEKSNEVGS